MNGAVLLLIMLLGHCFLPSSFPRFYVLVKEDKTWDEAQSYCRSNYTDLATVQNEDEQSELSQIIDHELFVWLGLRPDNSWTWSLENQDYYGVGEDGFRKWASGKPSSALSFYQMCAEMLSSGDWADEACSSSKPFICYRETSQNRSSSFILVTQTMTWMEAQSYCRAHYTDLASVRSQEDNDQIMTLLQNQNAWMGLHRQSWAWSDGSPYSFSYWDTSQTLSGTAADACLNANYGQWKIRACTAPNFFACYAIPVRQRLVRLVLKTTDSSVDMEQLKDDILRKLFSIVVLSCVTNEGYMNRPDEEEEYCIFNRNQHACTYAVTIGTLCFLYSTAFLALDVYFPQISGVKDRKMVVLVDIGVSALWSLVWFVGFCFLANQWQVSKEEDNPLNEGADAARASIIFSFFSVFSWGGLTLLSLERLKRVSFEEEYNKLFTPSLA